MKVKEVKNFVFKGSKYYDKAFFIEGIEDNMLLTYSSKLKKFLFAPVKYDGIANNLDDIMSEMDKRIPLITGLKIKNSRHLNILEVNLGEASFHLTHYFKNDKEREIYVNEVGKTLLYLNERYGKESTMHYLEGFVELEKDIENLVNNLREINVEEIKKSFSTSSIPSKKPTETHNHQSEVAPSSQGVESRKSIEENSGMTM